MVDKCRDNIKENWMNDIHSRVLELDLPEKLTAEPEEVANDVFQAFSKNRRQVYSKRIFKYIMWIIRNIPEKIFLKTKM